MALVYDADDKTPTIENPCPRCGSPLVIIGLAKVPHPEMTEDIWDTIFAERCVKAPLWQWCRDGHLQVRIVPPDHHVRHETG